MGCGVSRFERDKKEDQLTNNSDLLMNPLVYDADYDHNHCQATKLIGRKSAVFSRPNENKDQTKLEIKTTPPRKEEETTAEKNNSGSESRDQDFNCGDKEEIEHSHREDGLKFPGSPSFREYCNNSDGSNSRGRSKSNCDFEEAKCIINMSQMEEPQDVHKGLVVDTVKKESRVRRITGAIARSRQAKRKSFFTLHARRKSSSHNKDNQI